jgi:hypothetical protein
LTQTYYQAMIYCRSRNTMNQSSDFCNFRIVVYLALSSQIFM